MARAPRPYVEAAERWGYLADSEAHKYGLKNGATLLLKIASGESGFKMGAVSSAGARGATQFIPETRQSYIQHYGVDPWKSPDEAIHAAAIYMHTSGLAAYNPGGGQGYIDYILSQQVQASGERSRGRGQARGRAQPPEGSSGGGGILSGLSGDLMHAGLVATFVIGGATFIGLGITRLFGASRGTA